MRSRSLDEIRELRARIAALVDEATANERLLRKNQARELDLLRADKLPDLFNVLCLGLKQSYQLEATTLILQDPDHELRHLLMSENITSDQLPCVKFVDALQGLAPQFNSFQRPWLGPYIGSDHHALFAPVTNLGSIALIPLMKNDRVIGSLNFGSADEKRFSRHLATDFLAHLGVIASFALDNATNRARLVRSGLTDFLTGWHNRRYLQVRLKEELARAQRQQTYLTCLILDLDRFKYINDTFGHLAGDIALKEAAQRIDREIRGSDAAARYGGDEFVVLAPGLCPDQALAAAERVRKSVADAPLPLGPGQTHSVTVSIGIASVVPKRDSNLQTLADELLNHADQALYRAKEGGRNRVEVSNLT